MSERYLKDTNRFCVLPTYALCVKEGELARAANDDGITCDQFLIKRDLKIHKVRSDKKRISNLLLLSKSTLV